MKDQDLTLLEVTTSAQKEIREILARDDSNLPVRITMSGGCIGPHLGMLSDQMRRNDESFQVGEILFVVDKDTLDRFSPIRVDYEEDNFGGRFKITSPHLEMGV